MAYVPDALHYEIPPLNNMFLLPLCISGLSLTVAPGEGSWSQNAGVRARSCSHFLYCDQSHAHHVKSNASFLTFVRRTSCDIHVLQGGVQQLAGLPAPLLRSHDWCCHTARMWLYFGWVVDVQIIVTGEGDVASSAAEIDLCPPSGSKCRCRFPPLHIFDKLKQNCIL